MSDLTQASTVTPRRSGRVASKKEKKSPSSSASASSSVPSSPQPLKSPVSPVPPAPVSPSPASVVTGPTGLKSADSPQSVPSAVAPAPAAPVPPAAPATIQSAAPVTVQLQPPAAQSYKKEKKQSKSKLKKKPSAAAKASPSDKASPAADATAAKAPPAAVAPSPPGSTSEAPAAPVSPSDSPAGSSSKSSPKRASSSPKRKRTEIKFASVSLRERLDKCKKECGGKTYVHALERLMDEHEAAGIPGAVPADGEKYALKCLCLRALSCIVSAKKMSSVIALCQAFLEGKIDVSKIPSCTTIRRTLAATDKVCDQLLAKEFEDCEYLHALFDTSKREGTSRAPVFVCYWSLKEDCPVIKLLELDGLATQTAEEEARVIYHALERFGLQKKVISIIGDNCAGMQANGGVINKLRELLGPDVPIVVGLGCWLHVLSLALCFAVEKAFGKAEIKGDVKQIGTVTLQNLLYSLWWCEHVGMNPTEFAASIKLFIAEHPALGLKAPTKQLEKPVPTRWGSMIASNSTSLEFWKLWEVWSIEVSKKYTESSRKPLRETLEMIHAWCKDRRLLAQSTCLEELAPFFRAEMDFAGSAQPGFIAGSLGALMPRRVVGGKARLAKMVAQIEDFFPKTLEITGGDQTLPKTIVTAFEAKITEFGDAWLKFPQIVFALGSPTDGQSVAGALVHKMRDKKLTDDELKDPLLRGINDADVADVEKFVGAHLEDLKGFAFHGKCSPKLQRFINQVCKCAPSTTERVEGVFGRLTSMLHKSPGMSDKTTTEQMKSVMNDGPETEDVTKEDLQQLFAWLLTTSEEMDDEELIGALGESRGPVRTNKQKEEVYIGRMQYMASRAQSRQDLGPTVVNVGGVIAVKQEDTETQAPEAKKQKMVDEEEKEEEESGYGGGKSEQGMGDAQMIEVGGLIFESRLFWHDNSCWCDAALVALCNSRHIREFSERVDRMGLPVQVRRILDIQELLLQKDSDSNLILSIQTALMKDGAGTGMYGKNNCATKVLSFFDELDGTQSDTRPTAAQYFEVRTSRHFKGCNCENRERLPEWGGVTVVGDSFRVDAGGRIPIHGVVSHHCKGVKGHKDVEAELIIESEPEVLIFSCGDNRETGKVDAPQKEVFLSKAVYDLVSFVHHVSSDHFRAIANVGGTWCEFDSMWGRSKPKKEDWKIRLPDLPAKVSPISFAVYEK